MGPTPIDIVCSDHASTTANDTVLEVDDTAKKGGGVIRFVWPNCDSGRLYIARNIATMPDGSFRKLSGSDLTKIERS